MNFNESLKNVYHPKLVNFPRPLFNGKKSLSRSQEVKNVDMKRKTTSYSSPIISDTQNEAEEYCNLRIEIENFQSDIEDLNARSLALEEFIQSQTINSPKIHQKDSSSKLNQKVYSNDQFLNPRLQSLKNEYDSLYSLLNPQRLDSFRQEIENQKKVVHQLHKLIDKTQNEINSTRKKVKSLKSISKYNEILDQTKNISDLHQQIHFAVEEHRSLKAQMNEIKECQNDYSIIDKLENELKNAKEKYNEKFKELELLEQKNQNEITQFVQNANQVKNKSYNNLKMINYQSIPKRKHKTLLSNIGSGESEDFSSKFEFENFQNDKKSEILSNEKLLDNFSSDIISNSISGINSFTDDEIGGKVKSYFSDSELSYTRGLIAFTEEGNCESTSSNSIEKINLCIESIFSFEKYEHLNTNHLSKYSNNKSKENIYESALDFKYKTRQICDRSINVKRNIKNICMIGQYEYYEQFKVEDVDTGEFFSKNILHLCINNYPIRVKNRILNLFNNMLYLSHPAILKYIDFTDFDKEKRTSFLTEFINPKSLKINSLNPTQKLINIYGIASAMSYLHSHDILHRELSLSNIICDDNFYPKLINIGMKSLIEDIKMIAKIEEIPYFYPPEYYLNNEYNKSSEVYSFSLIVYEICTNKNPFEGVSLIDHIINIHQQKKPQFDIEIPDCYRNLIENCWKQNPNERPTFDEIKNELQNNPEFITKNVDSDEFTKYVDFIESTQNSSKNAKTKTNSNKSKETKNNSNKQKQNRNRNSKNDKDDDDNDYDNMKREDDDDDDDDDMKSENNDNEYSDKSEEEEEEEEEDEEEEEEDEDKEKQEKKETLEKINKKKICEILSKNDVARIFLKFYKIKKKIGEGSFGIVHKVTEKMNKQNRKSFAAKIFKINIFKYEINSAIVTEFLNELILHSHLFHPTIVKFIGYSANNFKCKHGKNRPVMMTEYIKYGSLYEMIKNIKKGLKIPGWNATTKLIIIYGIAASMNYLHSQNIIHRDLKPMNILIDNSFYPKLTDFGISLKLSGENLIGKNIIGTSPFIAPEIWIKKKYSKASDVYAFSILVYELMMNAFAFENCNSTQIFYKICLEKKRPILKKKIDMNYRKLIQSCWSENINERPTFSQICNELKTNQSFITEKVDEKLFRYYIQIIDQQLTE